MWLCGSRWICLRGGFATSYSLRLSSYNITSSSSWICSSSCPSQFLLSYDLIPPTKARSTPSSTISIPSATLLSHSHNLLNLLSTDPIAQIAIDHHRTNLLRLNISNAAFPSSKKSVGVKDSTITSNSSAPRICSNPEFRNSWFFNEVELYIRYLSTAPLIDMVGHTLDRSQRPQLRGRTFTDPGSRRPIQPVPANK